MELSKPILHLSQSVIVTTVIFRRYTLGHNNYHNLQVYDFPMDRFSGLQGNADPDED